MKRENIEKVAKLKAEHDELSKLFAKRNAETGSKIIQVAFDGHPAMQPVSSYVGEQIKRIILDEMEYHIGVLDDQIEELLNETD